MKKNDDPPSAYLAGYIWHKILYEYTNEEQREAWREKNPGIAVPIRVGMDDLRNRVEESIRNGRMKKTWISDVLDFLVDHELARRNLKRSTRFDLGIYTLFLKKHMTMNLY
jgi:hypothetical protein